MAEMVLLIFPRNVLHSSSRNRTSGVSEIGVFSILASRIFATSFAFSLLAMFCAMMSFACNNASCVVESAVVSMIKRVLLGFLLCLHRPVAWRFPVHLSLRLLLRFLFAGLGCILAHPTHSRRPGLVRLAVKRRIVLTLISEMS